MSLAAALRRIGGRLAVTTPVDVDTGGGLPWESIYPSSPPPAIARPATRPAPFRRVAAATAAPVDIAIANPDRAGLVVVNDSTAVLYLKHGPGASTSGYTVAISAGGTYVLEPPGLFLGPLTGIWAAPGGGAAVVTEL